MDVFQRPRNGNKSLRYFPAVASLEQIAGASAEAAEISLEHARRDPALLHAFWLLTQIPLAARAPDFQDSLKSLGLDVSDNPSLMEIVGAFSAVIGTAWAVSSGGGFLRWRCEKAWRVLLLDGEMPGADLQQRFKRVTEASQFELTEPDYLKIAASDLMPFGLPDLSDPHSQQFYDDVIADADLIVVDNLSTLCRGLKENDADSWVPVQSWALAQRRAGKSVLFVHHAGKSGTQRGTSRKEDVVDTVISVRRRRTIRRIKAAASSSTSRRRGAFTGPKPSPSRRD